MEVVSSKFAPTVSPRNDPYVNQAELPSVDR